MTLEPDVIAALAKAIVDQTILSNWLYYAVLSALTVVLASGGSFLGSYFAKRGERAAMRADFSEIKSQLKETTALAETVKVDIQRLSDRSEKLQWQKRDRLEKYLIAVADAIDFQSRSMNASFFDQDAPTGGDPSHVATMYQRLYLPELRAEHDQFLLALSEFQRWFAKGLEERAELHRQSGTPGAMSPPSTAHMQYLGPLMTKIRMAHFQIGVAAEVLARSLNEH